jgi:hypothetical protein
MQGKRSLDGPRIICKRLSELYGREGASDMLQAVRDASFLPSKRSNCGLYRPLRSKGGQIVFSKEQEK